MNDRELKYECFKIALSSGVLTSILSMIASSFTMNLIKLFGLLPGWREILILACIVAPIIEEILKPIGLIFCRDSTACFSLRDWALLGGTAGLGFAILENSFYYTSMLFSQGRSLALVLMVFRTFITTPMHVVASALAGIGIGFWKKRRVLLTPLAFACAIIIHSWFNFLIISR